jgi:Calx-beta domain-containing protein/cysteine-rich secretory family protein
MLLSVNPAADVLDPTPLEQELMEYLNRMRLDPQGELDALFSSLDPLVARDPDADEAINYFRDPTSEEIQSDWLSLLPVAPLTWNESLQESAIGHSLLMAEYDQQSHQFPEEPSPRDRALAAGYNDDLGVSVGENVFAYANSSFHAHSAFAIDWAVPDRSHRVNLMAAEYREVGIGIITDYDFDTDVGPLIVTQDFGSRASFDQSHLLGVVFDDLDEDGWYDSGEGLGDVTIEIEGTEEIYTVTSMSAGGYQVEVAPGVYTLTASGGGLSSPIVHRDIVVGVDNVKVDFVGSSGPNQRPSVDLNGPHQEGVDYAASFQKLAGPVHIVDAGLTVNDADDDDLVSATVTIANLLDAGFEMVAVNTAGTAIEASFNYFTGVLRLTGSQSVAGYQQVLRTLSYYNGATVPTGVSRSVEVTVNDGFSDSSVAISTVGFAPEISVDDAMLAEGDYGTTSFVFSVNLSTTSVLPVAVSYSFIDGTARSGSDYSNIGGQITFQPGQIRQTINVAVNGDTVVEEDEHFYVSLFNPLNASVVDAQAVATIANDDTAQDMGPLADALIDGLNPSAGRILLSFQTLNRGLLSLETLFDGPVDTVGIVLYDQFRNQQPLAVSSLVHDNQRIDWQTEAGTTYYVVIDGSAEDVTLRLVNLVDVGDGAVVVRGTAGDDTFEFDATASRNVTINGVRYEFDDAEVESLAFHGGDGYDTANLTSADPSADDSAELWPDHGTFNSAGVIATLTDVESINIDGGSGEDTVIIHDSAGDDEIYARAPRSYRPVSSITVTDWDFDDPSYVSTYAHSLTGFENLTAQSTEGIDVASFFDSDGNDEFIGRQFETVLKGPGFNFRAENFQYTHGYARFGDGDDTAELYDTPENDRFKADPTYARMFRGAFQRRAKFFETVVAYANSGGVGDWDDARLFDSLSNDQMIASPTETRLYSDAAGYDLTAVSFDAVLVRASSGPSDTAMFMGGAGNDLLLHKWLRQDTLEKSPKTEMMDYDPDGNHGKVYKVTARRFDTITAIGGQGGYDRAKFWDTLDDDRFVADGDTAAMYNPANELLYDAIAFDKVVFNHVNGGNDTTEKVYPIDFILSEYWPP